MITIKDIARIANVSHTTVSRALNYSPLIKLETAEKIRGIAQKLNYLPNINAKSLVLNKGYLIGLFFSSIERGTSGGFLSMIVNAMNQEMKHNYSLAISGLDLFTSYEFIHPQRYNGILLVSQCEDDYEFIEHVKQVGIPIVVLNRDIEDQAVLNILIDDKTGAYEATNYLIAQGHKQIGLLEGIATFASTIDRKNGFLQAMAEHELTVAPNAIVSGDYSTDKGYEAMRCLLHNAEPPTAVFCSNDEMAVGALRACLDYNIEVPANMSIVGFDDIVLSHYTIPPLTTVKRPLEQAVMLGVKRLSQLIDGHVCTEMKVVLNTELIKRETVIPYNQ